MTAQGPAAPSPRAFADALIGEGLLISTGVAGLFGQGSEFVAIIDAVQALLDAECAPDNPERRRFPPFTPREVIRRTGYMEGFPQLLGSVHAFHGREQEHPALLERVNAGDDWTPHLTQTELTLAPACCYPLYPTLSGVLPQNGRLFDLTAYCFRREPSEDPTRLQAFQMRENVRVGDAESVERWWSAWMERGERLLQSLALPVERVVANDPFFGRGGRMLKVSQRDQQLKYELVVPVCGTTATAVASFNCHRTHFTATFGIQLAGGDTAHSACMGFGLERVALALLSVHGLAPARWPESVHRRLWP